MHSCLQVRKCVIVAKRIVDGLFNDVHGLDVNERKETFCKACENGHVKGFLFNLSRMQKNKKKSKLKLLNSVKIVYVATPL